MNSRGLKGVLLLSLMIAFLILAIATKDGVNRQFFACLSVIIGAYMCRSATSQSPASNEQ